MKRKEILLLAGIYLLTLAIVLFNTLPELHFEYDSDIEWSFYSYVAQEGKWIETDHLLNSSLMAVYVPAFIQRFTKLPTDKVFIVFPALIFALIPVFVYLVVKKYLGIKIALLSVGFILSSYFFTCSPPISRFAIASGFLAITIFGLINKRYILSIVSGILVILSHYSTTYFMLYIIIALLILSMITRLPKPYLKFTSIVLSILLIGTGVWHFTVTKSPGEYGVKFVEDAIKVETPKQSGSSEPVVNTNSKLKAFTLLESREDVVQVAFGKGFEKLSNWQKLEWFLNWLIVALLNYGLYLVVRHKKLSPSYRFLAIASYIAIVLAVIIPSVSVGYGIMRTYFSALIVLAPCIVIGLKELSDKMKVNYAIISIPILLVYAVCSSNLMQGR